jgi:hypothetical protein
MYGSLIRLLEIQRQVAINQQMMVFALPSAGD